jgi:pimeloyl-ACP methyl ester esterase
MPFASHDGVSLRYDRAGGGPAVLLVHGWTCNRTFWQRQVTALRDRHTVVTVDLRGHGESSRAKKGYTIGAMTGDLEMLVRTLGVPHVAVVGWSMGGLVALELARRLGERVSALGLVCTTPGGLADPAAKDFDSAKVEEFRAGMRADLKTFLRGLAAQFFKAGAESPLHAWAFQEIQKTPSAVVEACFDGIMAADLRAHLKDVKVPTAVLHGRHDTLLPLAGGEAIKKAIKGATLTVFEQSAHAPFLEEPDAFNSALTELLSRTQ